MFKSTYLAIFALVAMFVPELASAGTLKPLNGDAWTLYVFGNGDAIFSMLNAIKLLMVPDTGTTGFNSLMMFLATLGFLVLAIQAGFDAGKNLMKMFTYVIVVAAVHIMTMQVTADIHISDPVTNYDNVVPGVPALVGVPAALVSEIGHWFTRTIETYYGIPTEMTMTGGTFNLFGRLMQESNEFVISNPELKKSLSAYTADCVVPAMAQGRMTASDMIASPNLIDTFANAKHNSILTKYWPTAKPNANGVGTSYPKSLTFQNIEWDVQGGLGAVLPCAGAYDLLVTDLKAHGEELMTATAKQWSKTGVLVPFEAGMTVAMQLASNGGANAFANYSKPQGFILQQAMINGMNGNFRNAAASIGNNEILMAASIAQAEQSQKSSWFTAARVFSNMMGYVYTTLQAFIFAIVPIVIIALMVPGLGKAMFVNYAQILVWLMLWQPMLSIVNFLITLFGKAQIGGTMDTAAGVTMQNKWIMTENTNDLMLAAQFLGTSVPLLTWGLVKGSLAFTEFISHGIGSSMAQQAGATAATGNMSLGNMSMDNTSMNKFNTAMSSAVGAQTTMGYEGGMNTSRDLGGAELKAMGSAVSNTTSTQMSDGLKTSTTAAIGSAKSAGDTASATHSLMKGNGFNIDDSDQRSNMKSTLEKASKSANDARGADESESADKQMARAGDLARSILKQAGTSGSAGLEAFGMGAKATLSNTEAVSNAVKLLDSISLGKKQSTSHKTGDSSSAGTDNTTSAQNARSNNSTHSTKLDKSDALATQQALQNVMTGSRQLQQTLESNLTNGNAKSGAGRATVGHYDDLRAQEERLSHAVPAALAHGAGETALGTGGMPAPNAANLTAGEAAVTAARSASPAHAAGGLRDTTRHAPGTATTPPGGEDATGALGRQQSANVAFEGKIADAVGPTGQIASDVDSTKADLLKNGGQPITNLGARDPQSFGHGPAAAPKPRNEARIGGGTFTE